MSLNYCDDNPIQGTENWHCFHVIGRHAGSRPGMHKTEARCCWCGVLTAGYEFVEHGPLTSGEKGQFDSYSSTPEELGLCLRRKCEAYLAGEAVLVVARFPTPAWFPCDCGVMSSQYDCLDDDGNQASALVCQGCGTSYA